jgi:hypothetical protein
VIKCVCGIGLEVPHIISVGHHMLKIYFRTSQLNMCSESPVPKNNPRWNHSKKAIRKGLYIDRWKLILLFSSALKTLIPHLFLEHRANIFECV